MAVVMNRKISGNRTSRSSLLILTALHYAENIKPGALHTKLRELYLHGPNDKHWKNTVRKALLKEQELQYDNSEQRIERELRELDTM